MHLEHAGDNRAAVYPLSLLVGGRSSGRGQCNKLRMKSPVVLEILDLVAVISGQPAMPSGGMWHPWMPLSWATFDPSPQEERDETSDNIEESVYH